MRTQTAAASGRLGLHALSHRYRRGSPFRLSVSWTATAPRTVLLGPNGAGKTTLLTIAAGALRPSSGDVRVGDLALTGRSRAAFLRAVGWMPQQVQPIAGLSCREQVAYLGWLKGLSRSDAWDRALEALERVHLIDQAAERVSRVSGGQLRRVGLAQALVTRPAVLLLDEPTAGLDPNGRADFRDLMAAFPPEVTLLVSTHQVDDIADIFDDVVVMAGGSIVWQGTQAGFLALAPPGSMRPAEDAYRAIVHESG